METEPSKPAEPPAVLAPAPTIMRQYKSPLRFWVWGCFTLSTAVAALFAILCVMVYQGFLDVVHHIESGAVTGVPLDVLQGLQDIFWGAAISAIFAFLLTVMFHVGTLFLLVCSFKSLGHPGRQFGKAFVIAAGFWTALHICNIALQFWSFTTSMKTFNGTEYQAGFNIQLLEACFIFGFISTGMYVIYIILLMFWRENPKLMKVEQPKPPPV